jgi:regulator of protease activity HflC (stomatin/prohibitin superfamily)
MFGIKFVKFEPNLHVLLYKNGKVKRQGLGLSFYYFAPTSSLIAIPLTSNDAPFIISETTVDFQEITIQGQITYRISDPQKISKLLNFTLNNESLRYISDDPEKLTQRIINVIKVIIHSEVTSLSLKDALRSSDSIVEKILISITKDKEIISLGIEILGISILAIKPNPETAKALEAQTREEILKESDEAIFLRRNAAVEQERVIKENELNTEIAIENKNKEILETKMESEKSVQIKRQEINESDMMFKIQIEEKNKNLVKLKMENSKIESDAKAYSVSAIMKSFEGVDPAILNSLATVGLESNQIIAMAFQGLAEKAEKIGQLNISPDLLADLLDKK